MPLAPPWRDQGVDLPVVLLNHRVRFIVPTALEQIGLYPQDAAGADLEGIAPAPVRAGQVQISRLRSLAPYSSSIDGAVKGVPPVIVRSGRHGKAVA